MWNLFIYFIIHLLAVSGKENSRLLIPFNDETEVFRHIANCITALSGVESKYRPTISIDTQNIKDKAKGYLFTEIVIQILMKSEIPSVIIDNRTNINSLDKTLIMEEDVNLKRKYTTGPVFVICIDTCDDITSLNFTNAKKELKYIVIIINPTSDECTDKFHDVKKSVDKYDITFILLDVTNDEHKVFKFIPKINNTCHEIVDKQVHINTCSNGTLQNNERSKPKITINFNKCPLRVGIATLFPFAQIEEKESLQTYDQVNEMTGSDVEAMKIVAKHVNATLHLHYIYRKEENPYGDYDFLKFLLNGSLDVCAGGLYRIYGNRVGYSGVYARQAVVWIYTAERAERSWQNLIVKLNSLYIFIIFYICYSIIWCAICIFDGNAVSLRNTLLYAWGALVGATSLQDARSVKQKILNLGYLVMCIHMSAYVSIQMYSFLTIREPPQMFKTNDEIMNSGRMPYLKTSTKYFVNDKKYVEFANKSAECSSFIDCAEKTFEYNGLTVVLQGNFYHFQSTTAVEGEARILRATENILTVYHEMLIRKESPIAAKFGRVIQSLYEAGILDRLYSEAIGILMMAKANSANSNMVMNSYSCQAGCTITFTQFAGVFYAWIFGCILSCIVLGFELCLKYKTMPSFR